MTVKVVVISYSATGTVHALAQAVAEGAAPAGAGVRLRRVAELAPDTATSIAQASVQDLAWADAFAFGTPTRSARRPRSSSSSSTRPGRAVAGPVPGTAAGPDHDPAAGGRPRHRRRRERPRNGAGRTSQTA